MPELPKSIFDLLDLENFRKRTAMFIGDRKISSLDSFVQGYFYAVQSNDVFIENKVEFNEFHDWVAGHFKWKESTAGWRRIILQECNEDEELALNKFFELYDQFKERKKTHRPGIEVESPQRGTSEDL
jgi:hypothetical protein